MRRSTKKPSRCITAEHRDRSSGAPRRRRRPWPRPSGRPRHSRAALPCSFSFGRGQVVRGVPQRLQEQRESFCATLPKEVTGMRMSAAGTGVSSGCPVPPTGRSRPARPGRLPGARWRHRGAYPHLRPRGRSAQCGSPVQPDQVRSAPDRAHRAARLQEPGVVDAVPGELAPHRGAPAVGDLRVVGTAAQRGAQVGLVAGEQAVADLAVGRQPGAVAGAAERPGDRGDDADRGRAAVDERTARPGRSPRSSAVGRQGELALAAPRGSPRPSPSPRAASRAGRRAASAR